MKASAAILISACVIGAATSQSAMALGFGKEYWDSLPLTGSARCSHPDLLHMNEYNDAFALRTVLCAVKSSLIVTNFGARAQMILAIEGRRAGNSYSAFWKEVNCETMEERFTMSVWSFQGHEPSSYGKSKGINSKGMDIWSEGRSSNWSNWMPITSNDEEHKWLCKQWRAEQARF